MNQIQALKVMTKNYLSNNLNQCIYKISFIYI